MSRRLCAAAELAADLHRVHESLLHSCTRCSRRAASMQLEYASMHFFLLLPAELMQQAKLTDSIACLEGSCMWSCAQLIYSKASTLQWRKGGVKGERDRSSTHRSFEHGIVRLEAGGALLPEVALAVGSGCQIASHSLSSLCHQNPAGQRSPLLSAEGGMARRESGDRG